METITIKSITLEKLHRLALDNGIAFVSFRLPNTAQPTTMLQWQHTPLYVDDIDKLKDKSGFVFAPFHVQAGMPIRLIQPDLIMKGETFHEPEKEGISGEGNNIHSNQISFAESNNYISAREEFTTQVEKVQQMISEHTIEKLVLSRVSQEEKPENFDSAAVFNALEKVYPDAFVFALYIPDAGLWFGASPEPLLLVKSGLVSTVSLAGTRPYVPENKEQSWGEKEIDEQQIVTQYIEDILEKFKIGQVEKLGPASFVAGSIEHLKTTFIFPVEELDDKLTEFLKALHPTPSVCGLPKEISMQFIDGIEKHRREYYSGFLGPVNTNGDWDIYVNLRSVKTLSNRLEYYLGAGITMGSLADQEWEETISKMNTMKSIVESLKGK